MEAGQFEEGWVTETRPDETRIRMRFVVSCITLLDLGCPMK